MPIDLSKFTNTSKSDGVAVYQREVKTPLPENEDGSGYTTEKNLQTAYRAGRDIIKVMKVSDTGWSVWHYKETDDGIETVGVLDSGLGSQEAHRLAQKQS